ncbi:MAG TPA: ATP-binding cassette domain-containing protein, partial [Thermoanaerobaculia bacterium]|nr:ATP-binding cassette domain-containing protein [Thermoanaerobaculia bacterium]
MSSGGSGGPLLAARGLGWHAAGRRILGPLELDVERGESVAVVGPNGAGKTTLLRLLAGLLAPSAGEVRLAGRPLASYSRKGLARRIAYV